MPIVKAKPTTEPSVVENIPRIDIPQAKSVVVDTKFTPLSSLITYVEGSTWVVNYYSQVIDRDNDLRGQDPGQSAVYQQYKNIEQTEIKVASALSWSQDQATKTFTATGSANIHSFVIPNEGDMFCADVGDGREGVFQVTLSEKKSLLKESVYFIEYFLVYYSDNEPNRRKDLDNKTVEKLFYLKDFILHGQNPLVIPSAYKAVEDLKSLYYEIIQNYMAEFFSKEFSTILVPGQTTNVYDRYVTETLLSILETRDDSHIQYIRKLNTDDDYALKQPTIWQALIKRDKSLLKISNKKMGLISVNVFSLNPVFGGIRFSGINYIVYPITHPATIDGTKNKVDTPKFVSDVSLRSVPSVGGSLEDLIYDNTLTVNNVVLTVINNVLKDDYYVFSSAFYNNGPGQTVLENLTNRYLNKEALDPIALLGLASNYTNWGGLEKFYYLPIVLILIKATIRSY